MALSLGMQAGSALTSFFGSSAANSALRRQLKKQYKENERVANRRRWDKQNEINRQLAQAAFADQDLKKELIRVQGGNAAVRSAFRSNHSASGMKSSRAGRTQGRIDAEVMSNFGTNMTKLAMNKIGMFDQYQSEMEAISDSQRAANQQARQMAQQQVTNPGMDLLNSALKIGGSLIGSLPNNPFQGLGSSGASPFQSNIQLSQFQGMNWSASNFNP